MKNLKRILAFMMAFIMLASANLVYAAENKGNMPLNHIKDKILAKNSANKTLDLELAGQVKLAEDCRVYQVNGDEILSKSLSDVMVGSSNAHLYYTDDGLVDLILLDGPTPLDNVRVGIMNNGFASLDHTALDFKSSGGLKIEDKVSGRIFEIAPDTLVNFTNQNDTIKVLLNGEEIYSTSNRIFVLPAKEDKIQIMTFKRAYGYPLYRGFFEITKSTSAGKLNLINEVQFEHYLYQVVPSEMPASFGLEALKAQAVAARTYALSDYYSNRYAARGFHVDDSTLSQVYNNSAENTLTKQAVDETRGIIMRNGNNLVDSRYYSTSGGYGASKHEVWSDPGATTFPGTPVSYLKAKSYTYDPQDNSKIFNIDTQNEAEINSFYKNLSLTGYDSASLYFRWKVGLTKQELQNTINKNILLRYAADPNFILTRDEGGNYISKPIPSNGIGEFRSMYVAKRGEGGNITELVVEGTTGTYKILKEYNIRFTIRPNKTDAGVTTDILAYRAKGGSTSYDPTGTLKNPSILYSAFFTFDIAADAAGNPTSIIFYGGGNGHGVGMSQYGASMLGLSGWNFQQILKAYYSEITLVNFYDENVYLDSDPHELLVDTITRLHRDSENDEASRGLIPGQWINKYIGGKK